MLYLSLLCFSLVAATPSEGDQIPETPEQTYEKEIKQIDAQIKKLEIEKARHAELSAQYQKEGDRWQYTTGNIQDAYALWAKADEERKQVAKIQIEIDALESKKNLLYQFNIYQVGP